MLKRVGRWIAVSAVALAASCATAAGNPDLPRSYERPALPARTPVPAPVQPASNYGYLPPPPQPLARYSPPPYRPDLVPDADRRASYSYPAPTPSTPSQYAEWSDQDYRYRLGPGDQLALRFLLNPDLNGPATIGPDGRGVFPLVSAVKVADLTAEEANAVLTDAYAQILRRPQVEVLITAYGAAQIYVGGEVRNPGVLPIKGQLTTAQAVMSAGGLLPTARTGRIVILRERADGQLLRKEIDLKAYLTKAQGRTDFAILPGDLIFVPRSKIAEVDLFVDQYINGLLPFSRSVGYSVNRGSRF